MIFYFSATGNSKYVAKRLSAVTGGDMISIPECVNAKRFSFTALEGEAVGIVSPTYVWRLPSIVEDFLQTLKLTVPVGTYLYYVTTFGTTPGPSDVLTDNILCQKGLSLTARFSVKMPDTWTPVFDLSDKEKVAECNSNAEPQIEFILHKLQKRVAGDFMQNKAPYLVSRFFTGPIYAGMRKTAHFSVTDDCIGCGLCANKCPVQAIVQKSGKPIWIKEQCVMCLGCLHRCPKFAIQYGKQTRKHGQYQNPHVTV